MPGTGVIGLQWGDEAKGKLVDLLTERHDIVVRYQGGANAGHTVVVGDQTYKLSLIPSGILAPQVKCVVAGGVVVNPASLLGEIDGLLNRGVDCQSALLLSDRAHVIFPWHMEEDRLLDSATSSGENIGTTQRGIGPAYRDKVGRSLAIRLGDMLRPDFPQRVRSIAQIKKLQLGAMGGETASFDPEPIIQDYSGYAERLRPMIGDTTSYLLDALDAGKHVLFEGAQGALLDVDHGTYPYVTSSNSSGVGIASGSGVPAKALNKVIGVVKAYSTRVGGGPFPTEQDNALGQQLRDQGNEYGTVTRRPRRCGWFDAVAARYTARLSGVDSLAVMLLDVLSGMPELKICTGYLVHGELRKSFPSHVDELRIAEPVYETHPSWKEDISGVRRLVDLPTHARSYLDRIQALLDRPVEWISVGPERTQTIHVRGA